MLVLRKTIEEERAKVVFSGVATFVWTLAGIALWKFSPVQDRLMILLVFVFLITFFGVALREYEWLTRRFKNDRGVHG